MKLFPTFITCTASILLLFSNAGLVIAQEAAKGGAGPAAQGPRAQMESLFTPEERNQFREKMRAAKTREERAEIQKQMRGTAEQRAKEKGINLARRADGQPPRGEGDGKNGARRPQLFTPEERAQHRDKLRTAKTPEERQALRRELRAEMEQRAKAKGITLPQRPRRDGAPKGPLPAQNS